MSIGSLYRVKKWFWLLFPTKEIADAVHSAAVQDAAPAAYAVHSAAYAAWYSTRFNCEVTYFSLDSYIVFLEEDGIYKKVLTSDGLIGWTWFTENYNDCFEILDFEKIEK
jgi:hypothetical protein